MEKIDVEQVVNQAIAAAKAAADKTVSNNPDVWYPCGFAWVNIKPARGPLVKYLKDKNLGRTSYDGGLDVWNPSGNPTQWMDAKYDGAKAFAEVLRQHGIKATPVQRID